MCGIFAYNGKQNAIPLLVEGLRNLEYRGYDSAGVLGINKEGNIFLEKAVGKVSNLARQVDDKKDSNTYHNGIAHTRWATHGKVTVENTHPHFSNNNRFFVVHNGIIENYLGIKRELQKKYEFYSDTDTEVIAKLIEELFDGDIKSTLDKVIQKLVGAYAIAVIDTENPDTLVGAKLGSPMIIGESNEGIFLSSDINALGQIATQFTTLDDHETVVIQNGKFEVFANGDSVNKRMEVMDETHEIADKGDFPTFTQKEIYEIPDVLKNCLNGRVNFEEKMIHNETLQELDEYDIESIEIIASGSSYFAGVVGKSWFESLSGIKTEVRVSSEFLYETFLPNKKTLYIFMSQSGETADVREGIKMVQQKGCLTFGIVNVVGSTIARMCDMGLYTYSGVEIGVASTKNIVNQLAVLLIMALHMGASRDLQINEIKKIISDLEKIPNWLRVLTEQKESIHALAKKYAQYKNFFFLGRNVVQGTAAECSLKLKELSYLHAECYATGELKHGPLALVGPEFPCIVINPAEIQNEKTVSNVKEIKARDGVVLGVLTEGDEHKEIYDDVIELPKTHPTLSPFLPLIPLWMMSVEIATLLGKDIDKPQNLAKSVTVE
ncbi:glutamine--fructose-6-phosphate transaminase (isomerizing) [Candidatus Gracilibacteria bacterium]|nr:glutamine--fructose-6-phosphate transaminase (isomerizing) [Candidatus Gracilibacteria bacterium]